MLDTVSSHLAEAFIQSDSQ